VTTAFTKILTELLMALPLRANRLPTIEHRLSFLSFSAAGSYFEGDKGVFGRFLYRSVFIALGVARTEPRRGCGQDTATHLFSSICTPAGRTAFI
jgi:hypothetical protein